MSKNKLSPGYTEEMLKSFKSFEFLIGYRPFIIKSDMLEEDYKLVLTETYKRLENKFDIVLSDSNKKGVEIVAYTFFGRGNGNVDSKYRMSNRKRYIKMMAELNIAA